MEKSPSLLVMGNEKLSASVAHFDIPPIVSCPGRSTLCAARCYARRGLFVLPQVKARHRWAFEQTKRPDFVGRMADELFRSAVLLMRWHVAGDIYSPGYCRKIASVVEQSPHTLHWAYARSWRIPQIAKVLRKLARLPNMQLWYSCDAETGKPRRVPHGVRVAWMLIREGEAVPKGSDLVFLDHPLRKGAIELPTVAPVCPQEIAGNPRGITCATCQLCWRE